MAQYDDDNYDEELLDEEDAQKGKFITFTLGAEEYAIEIKYVNEIVGLQKITQLPDMADFIKGIINLRGKVYPIIDVRKRFKLPEIVYDERSCIIIVVIEDAMVGLIVDAVSEVLDIDDAQIDPAPKSSKIGGSKFIKGIGKVGEKVIIILDLTKMFSDNELAEVSELAV
jgi:purine-binding chemotaxis protein CheW